MKPKIKLSLTPQFQIPPPFKVWCHRCDTGFMSIDESQKHEPKCKQQHGARGGL